VSIYNYSTGRFYVGNGIEEFLNICIFIITDTGETRFVPINESKYDGFEELFECRKGWVRDSLEHLRSESETITSIEDLKKYFDKQYPSSISGWREPLIGILESKCGKISRTLEEVTENLTSFFDIERNRERKNG